MNLKSIVDKLDQLVDGARKGLLPPQVEIERLRKHGLTEEEAVGVWRRAVRGRGWTVDSIEDIYDEIKNALERRTEADSK